MQKPSHEVAVSTSVSINDPLHLSRSGCEGLLPQRYFLALYIRFRKRHANMLVAFGNNLLSVFKHVKGSEPTYVHVPMQSCSFLHMPVYVLDC